MKQFLSQALVDPTTLPIFEALYELILLSNQQLNLTRIVDKADFIERHLLDSLQLLKYLPKEQPLTLIDVGTGGGFPGLPLWIARPEWSLTLVDATQKKVKAIQEISQQLQQRFPEWLKTVPLCLAERAETIGQNICYREQFEIVTSRAVAPLPTLLELCLPLTAIDGSFIAMKGRNYEQELRESETALTELGASLVEVKTYQLAGEQSYTLLFFKKIHKTPPLYPRRAGVPNKKPL